MSGQAIERASAIPAVTSISTRLTTAGVIRVSAGLSVVPTALHVNSGELAAATYSELLAVTGAGFVDLVGCYVLDTTSRTIGIKIVIDGTTVFDQVSPAITTTNRGFYAVGQADITSTVDISTGFQNLRFNTSLSLQIKSSLAETDKIVLLHNVVAT